MSLCSIQVRALPAICSLVFAHTGDNFAYTERQRVPGPIVGALLSILFIMFGLLALFPPLKPVWKALLPKLGGKPTQDTMKNGFWKLQLVGQSVPDSSGRPIKVVAELSVSVETACLSNSSSS